MLWRAPAVHQEDDPGGGGLDRRIDSGSVDADPIRQDQVHVAVGERRAVGELAEHDAQPGDAGRVGIGAPRVAHRIERRGEGDHDGPRGLEVRLARRPDPRERTAAPEEPAECDQGDRGAEPQSPVG